MQISKPRLQKNYKWLVLGLATWAQASASFVTQGVGPLIAFWQDIYNLSQTEAGLLLSAINIGPVLSMMFLGSAIDKHGERYLISTGLLLLGFTTLSVTFVKNYTLLLVVLGVAGAWYAVSQPGGSKVIIKWFPAHQRGLAMGIRQAGIPIGGAITAGFLPFIIVSFGVIYALWIQALVAILGGIMFGLFYRDGFQRNETKTEYKFLHQLKKVVQKKQLHPVFFVGITLVSLQFILVAHLIIYLHESFNISLSVSGLLLGVVQIFGVSGRITLAWLSDKVWQGDRLNPLLFSVWTSMIVVFTFTFLPTDTPVWVISILTAFVGFFGLGWYSLFIVHISENTDSESIGLTVSFALTLNQIAIVIAPPMFGLLVDVQGSYYLAWSLLAIMIGVGGLWLQMTRSRAHHS